MVNLTHSDLRNLPSQCHQEVHGGAHRGEVINRDQGVHLELSRAQQALDHGKTEGLAGDTGNLVDDTDPDELDLTDRGNDNTNDDSRNVEEHLQIGLRDAENPAGQEDRNRSGSLIKSADCRLQM